MADPTKAWERAFASGSKEMQGRLKKVHAKNPAFQSWLQSSGHAAGESVKQASKEVKQTVRAKQLASKSATAYGATKGLAVGGEHGGSVSGMDQKAGEVKIYTPDEIAKLNKERGAVPVELSAKEKRERMIKAAVERAAAKKARSFDVPTLQQQHDDLRDVHDALHAKGVRASMDEEVEQVDEANMRFDPEAAARPKSSDVKNFLNRNKNRRAAAATKKYIRRMTKLGGLGPNQSKKDTEAHMKAYFEEVEQVDEASNKYEVTKTKSRKMPMEFDSEAKMHYYDVHHNDKRVGTLTHDTYFGETNGKLHGKDLPNIRNYGDNPHNQLHNFLKSKTGQKWAANLHKYQKEEVELQEGYHAATIAAIAAHAYEPKVGDKVRTRKGGQIPGKVEKIEGNKVYFRHPEGKLYATHSSNLMREAVKDAADEGEYDYEGDMAKSQLRSIMHNAKRMHDMLEDNTNLPEWVQSKITLAEDYISTAANYMQGEMNEAVEPKVATRVSIPTAAPRVDQFPATVPATKIKLPGRLKVLSPVVNAPVVQRTARRAATAARNWFTSLKQAKTTVPAKVPPKVDTKTMDPAAAALTVAAGVAGLATQVKPKPEVAVQTQTQTKTPTQTEPQVVTVTAPPKPAEVKPETQTQVKPKPETQTQTKTQTQTQTATSAGPPPPAGGKTKPGLPGGGKGGKLPPIPKPSMPGQTGMGKYYSGGRTSFMTGTTEYGEIPKYYQFEAKALPGLSNLPSVRKNKLARVKASKMSEDLDPVGKEDTDVNNDNKHNTPTDKYILNKRNKIGRAIQSMSNKKNGK